MEDELMVIDYSNVKISNLLCIKKMYSKKNLGVFWLWQCDCGSSVIKRGCDVNIAFKKFGKASCGCLHKKAIVETGRRNKTHGLSKHKLYDVHRQMIKRCSDPSNKDYPGYGGRGISVCNEWMDIHEFFNWARKSGYKEGLTIERIDVNGNYEPSNCTWVLNNFQGKNTRRVKYLEFNGKKLSLSDWSRELNISIRTILTRIRLGWSVEKILTTKPRKGRNQHG